MVICTVLLLKYDSMLFCIIRYVIQLCFITKFFMVLIGGKNRLSAMSEQPLCKDDVMDDVHTERLYSKVAWPNRYGISHISYDILSGESKRPLSSERVAREMGLQGIEDVSKHAVTEYTKQLTHMKTDICNLTKIAFQSLCIRKAIALGVSNSQNDTTPVMVSSWSEISQSYIKNPSWEKIEQLYHVLYTALDFNPTFHHSLEEQWMNTNNVKYSNNIPTTEGYKSGIHSVIVMKVNMMRKDFNKKISGKHFFKITKSVPKTNGKQAKRRIINQFKKDYVTIDTKTASGILPSNVKTFDDYLKYLYGENYDEYRNNNEVKVEEVEYANRPSGRNIDDEGTNTCSEQKSKTSDEYIIANNETQVSHSLPIYCDNRENNSTAEKLNKLQKNKLNIQKEQKKLLELKSYWNDKVAAYKQMMDEKEKIEKYNAHVKTKNKKGTIEQTKKNGGKKHKQKV